MTGFIIQPDLIMDLTAYKKKESLQVVRLVLDPQCGQSVTAAFFRVGYSQDGELAPCGTFAGGWQPTDALEPGLLNVLSYRKA